MVAAAEAVHRDCWRQLTDLGAFARRGGKLIVAIGTNDTLASPGAQLDY